MFKKKTIFKYSYREVLVPHWVCIGHCVRTSRRNLTFFLLFTGTKHELEAPVPTIGLCFLAGFFVCWLFSLLSPCLGKASLAALRGRSFPWQFSLAYIDLKKYISGHCISGVFLPNLPQKLAFYIIAFAFCLSRARMHSVIALAIGIAIYHKYLSTTQKIYFTLGQTKKLGRSGNCGKWQAGRRVDTLLEFV